MDIDRALARIGRQEPHRGLDGLEDRVLASIGERPVRLAATRVMLGATAFALLLGVAGGLRAVPGARAAPLAPFGMPGTLAPSTLLLGRG